jgi:hypothetical protein
MKVAKWASNTRGHHDCHLTMQNDGNLVIYNSSGKAVWASNTVGMGQMVLIEC